MRSHSATLAAIAALTLTGCAGGMSGLGGSPTYGCQAPKGTVCTSVSGVYANSLSGDRSPVWSTLPAESAKPALDNAADASSSATEIAPSPRAPEALRTAPRVLRLWIAPWEDSDGDLHEASVVHVLVNAGQWRMARVRPAQDVKPEVTRPALSATPTSTPTAPLSPTSR